MFLLPIERDILYDIVCDRDIINLLSFFEPAYRSMVFMYDTDKQLQKQSPVTLSRFYMEYLNDVCFSLKISCHCQYRQEFLILVYWNIYNFDQKTGHNLVLYFDERYEFSSATAIASESFFEIFVGFADCVSSRFPQ